jgi:hypothetical protein
MQKELSMNRIFQAMLLACVLLTGALLAVLGIVPEAVAQYAPLAVVPFIVSRQPSCRIFGKGKAA